MLTVLESSTLATVFGLAENGRRPHNFVALSSVALTSIHPL